MSIFSRIDSDELLKENISEEVTNLLESISNTESIINSYMIESSTIINEASIIGSVQVIITRLIEFIKGLYEKFISLFMTQTDYIKYILDRHSEKIHKLTDNELKNLVYQYKNFNIDKNIPVFGYLNNVQKYIDKLSSFKVDHADIESFKDVFSTELAIIRGKIIGKNKEVTEYDFIAETRSVFRGSNEVYMKHMTKNELDKMIDGVYKYKNTKNMIESNRNNLIQEYSKYAKVISNLMSINYNDDAFGGVLNNKDGQKRDVDIIMVNKHKTYQNLIVSFISQVAEAYSIVFREKLIAIKDKYEMEMSILSQVIHLV